ncbi:hypothetical protein [Castellaniella caeni]|uniref:hypothetical protein n=1 Tax=Castellaniella caeni TaxID=266123 RepID=UPI0012ED8111|nr:hypothetical protein [Castellaniella caeni]
MEKVLQFLEWFVDLPIPMMVDHGAGVKAVAAMLTGSEGAEAQSEAAARYLGRLKC